MVPSTRRIRLFLDTGVIIRGCLSPFSAERGVLVLTAQTRSYTVVLADPVEQELERVIARMVSSPGRAQLISDSMREWRKRTDIERCPAPTEADLESHRTLVLPVLKHLNDLPVVVAALLARPDWVLSSNTEHWTQARADRVGLRIITPWDFLARFQPV